MGTELATIGLEIGEAALEPSTADIDSALVFETQTYSMIAYNIVVPIEWVLSPWPGEDGAFVEWNHEESSDYYTPTDGPSYEVDLAIDESSFINVDGRKPIDISWLTEDLALDSRDPESSPLPEPLACELGADSSVGVAGTTATPMIENPEFADTTSGILEPQICYCYDPMAPFIEAQVSPWPGPWPEEDGAFVEWNQGESIDSIPTDGPSYEVDLAIDESSFINVDDRKPIDISWLTEDLALGSGDPEPGPLSDPLIGESATDDLVRSDWPLPYMRSVTASSANLRSIDAGDAELPIGPDVVASSSAMAALPDPSPDTGSSAGNSPKSPVPQPGVDQITGRLVDAQPGAGKEVVRNLAAEPAPEITPAPDDYATTLRGRSFQFALESQAILATPRRQESGEAFGTTSELGTSEGTIGTAPASTRSIRLPLSMTGSSVRNPMEAGWGTESLLAPLIADLVPDLFMI